MVFECKECGWRDQTLEEAVKAQFLGGKLR